jgi:ribosomal protein S18 acetylase RimI-like enzyme
MPETAPKNDFRCRSGALDDIVAVVRKIDGWDPYEMVSRGVDHLPPLDHVLVVEAGDGELVGFRAGYECDPGAFRCWLVAVLPEYRRRGLAKLMYDEQKVWLVAHGFREIRTYTRASNPAMLHILRSSGYEQVNGVEVPGRKPGDWVDFVKPLGLEEGL